jgi:hypothetical protein
MADYDLSKAARDRSDYGSGAGGLGFILIGLVVVLVVLYAIFGGAGVATAPEASGVTVPEGAVPEAVPTGDITPVTPTE